MNPQTRPQQPGWVPALWFRNDLGDARTLDIFRQGYTLPAALRSAETPLASTARPKYILADPTVDNSSYSGPAILRLSVTSRPPANPPYSFGPAWGQYRPPIIRIEHAPLNTTLYWQRLVRQWETSVLACAVVWPCRIAVFPNDYFTFAEGGNNPVDVFWEIISTSPSGGGLVGIETHEQQTRRLVPGLAAGGTSAVCHPQGALLEATFSASGIIEGTSGWEPTSVVLVKENADDDLVVHVVQDGSFATAAYPFPSGQAELALPVYPPGGGALTIENAGADPALAVYMTWHRDTD